MKKATFYILPTSATPNQSEPAKDDMPAHFVLACQLAEQCYQQNQRVLIFTDNDQDAFAIDEYLWQLEPNSFVPHNLAGEGPANGAPVEISWTAPRHRHQVLINLSTQAPAFAVNFAQVIDFVPSDDKLKQQARERYKAYRAAGLQLATQPLSEAPK